MSEQARTAINHRPTLDDVKRAIGGEDVLLDAVRRSFHDHYDAVIAAETLLPIVQKVWDEAHANGSGAAAGIPTVKEEQK